MRMLGRRRVDLFPAQTCTGLGVGMLSCASEPMFLATANAEKGDSEEESRKFSRLWERAESGHPGPDKMTESRGERQDNGCT